MAWRLYIKKNPPTPFLLLSLSLCLQINHRQGDIKRIEKRKRDNATYGNKTTTTLVSVSKKVIPLSQRNNYLLRSWFLMLMKFSTYLAHNRRRLFLLFRWFFVGRFRLSPLLVLNNNWLLTKFFHHLYENICSFHHIA